uniref:Uncharacterized protein n=1 Tax=Setaria italica TaxID=4555 RepID=K4A3V7_SETIT
MWSRWQSQSGKGRAGGLSLSLHQHLACKMWLMAVAY